MPRLPAWIRERWRRVALGAALCRFVDDAEQVAGTHSKRNRKDAELRRLQETGQQLLDAARQTVRQRALLHVLGRIALRLGDHDALVSLFELALARRIPLDAASIQVLHGTVKRVKAPPALVQRLGNVCNAVLASGIRLPPDAHAAISARGTSRADRLAKLRQIVPARRTRADWIALVTQLLEHSEGKDGHGTLVEAIGTLDEGWPALSASEAGPRLLTRLSITAAAKIAFAACCSLSTAAVEQAANTAPHIGDLVCHPLRVFERFATGAGRYAYAWEIMSIELLWHVDFPTGTELRRAVLDTVLDGVVTAAYAKQDSEAIGTGVFRSLHQSEDLWEDPARAARLRERAARAIDLMAEPRRTVFRGILLLAGAEEEAAEALFAQRRGPAFETGFNGYGHISFIGPTAAAAYLDGPLADPSLSAAACGFRFDKWIDRDPQRLTAVACADPAYANRFAHDYAQRLFQLDKRSTVHFHLLGRPEALDADLRAAIAANPRISLSSEEPAIRMPYYYATVRFLRAAQLQEALGSALLLTDIDEAYKVSPDRLYPQWLQRGDVGLRAYDRIRTYPRNGMIGMKAPRMETWGSISAACCYLGPGIAARQFGQLLSRMSHNALAGVRNNDNSNWWIDQNILYASLRPAVARIEGLQLFNLLDGRLPFGKYAFGLDTLPPPRGHRPGMPDIPIVPRPGRDGPR